MTAKKFSVLIISLFLTYLAGAQDIIHKTSGEKIPAIIVDVSPGVIKYRNFDDNKGPVYSLARDQVVKIVYENGKVVEFEKADEPDEIPVQEREVPQPVKQSPILGWHLGFGASTIYGDISNVKVTMASTIGATFGLPLGKSIGLTLGLDILSVGCAFEEDFDFIDGGTRIVITDSEFQLGYIGLILQLRFYLNKNKNIFIEPGMYSSFLISGIFSGERTDYDTISGRPITPTATYEEDWTLFYNPFDWGFAGGIGGRIPLGKSKKWHITATARFYYGRQNILDYETLGYTEEVRESNIFGLVLVGVDLPTRSKDR